MENPDTSLGIKVTVDTAPAVSQFDAMSARVEQSCTDIEQYGATVDEVVTHITTSVKKQGASTKEVLQSMQQAQQQQQTILEQAAQEGVKAAAEMASKASSQSAAASQQAVRPALDCIKQLQDANQQAATTVAQLKQSAASGSLTHDSFDTAATSLIHTMEEKAAALEKIRTLHVDPAFIEEAEKEVKRLEAAIASTANAFGRLRMQRLDGDSLGTSSTLSTLSQVEKSLARTDTAAAHLNDTLNKGGATTSTADASHKQLLNTNQLLAEALKALGKNTTSVAAAINAEANAARNAADATADASQAMQQAADSTDSFKFGLKDMVKQAAAFAGVNLGIDTLKEFVGNIVSTRREMESYQVSLQSITGDTAKANTIYSQLKDFANSTPMTFSSLMSGAQVLLGFGIEADKVVDTLKMLGDISMGDANRFQSLALVFAQMTATGKLMAQDLNQMVTAGFNPLSQMAKDTGQSVGQLKEQMSSLQGISADRITESFFNATREGGMFFNMLNNQADTLNGVMNTLSGAIDNMFNELGESSEGILKGAISVATTLANNYETVGRILAVLIAAYGSYHAALITSTALSRLHSAALAASTTATTLAARAQAVLNATVKANPYVLAASAIATLVMGVYQFKDSLFACGDEVSDITDRLAAHTDALLSAATSTDAAATADQRLALAEAATADATGQANDATTKATAASLAHMSATEQQAFALEALKKKYPELLSGYDAESLRLKDLIALKKQMADIDQRRAQVAKQEQAYSQAKQTGDRNHLYLPGSNQQNRPDEKASQEGKRLADLYAADVVAALPHITDTRALAQYADRLQKELDRVKAFGGNTASVDFAFDKPTAGAPSTHTISGLIPTDVATLSQTLAAIRTELNQRLDPLSLTTAYQQALNNYNTIAAAPGTDPARLQQAANHVDQAVEDFSLAAERMAAAPTPPQPKIGQAANGNLNENVQAVDFSAPISKQQKVYLGQPFSPAPAAQHEANQQAARSLSDIKQQNDTEKVNALVKEVAAARQAYQQALDTNDADGVKAAATARDKALNALASFKPAASTAAASTASSLDALAKQYQDAVKYVDALINSHTATGNQLAAAHNNADTLAEQFKALTGGTVSVSDYLSHQNKAATANNRAATADNKEEERLRKEADAAAAKAEQERAQAEKEAADALKQETADRLHYLSQFGSYYQRRDAITEKGVQDAAAAPNPWAAQTAKRNTQDQLLALDKQQVQLAIDWASLISGLESMLRPVLDQNIDDLQAFLSSEGFKNQPDENKQQYKDLLQSLIAARNNSTLAISIPFKETADAMRDYQAAIDQYAAALKQRAANPSTENNEAVAAAQNNLIAKQHAAVSSYDNLNNSVDSITAALQNMHSSVSGFGNTLSRLASSMGNNILSMVISLISTILEIFKNGIGSFVSDIVTMIFDAINGFISDIFSGDFIMKPLSAFKDGLSSLADTLTFGGLSSWIGEGNAKEVAETTERLTKQNEYLQRSIEALTDSFDAYTKGSAAVDAYSEQYEKQQLLIENSRQILEAQMNYHNAHQSNSAYINNEFSSSDWQRISEIVGQSVTHAGTLWSLTPEQFQTILAEAPDLYTKISETGKYDKSSYLDDYVALAGTLDDIADTINSNLLNDTSCDNFYNSFTSMLADMESDADDFAADLNELLTKSLLSNTIADEYGAQIKALYNKMATQIKSQNGNLSASQVAAYQAEYRAIVQDAIDTRDQILALTEYNATQDAASGATNSVAASFSEETATEIAGRLTAVQVALYNLQDNHAAILTQTASIATNTATLVTLATSRNALLASLNDNLALNAPTLTANTTALLAALS